MKITLTRLELKISQFGELEELLEDGHHSLKSAQTALFGKQVNLKETLDQVKPEIAKHVNGSGFTANTAVSQAQAALDAGRQSTRVTEVSGALDEGLIKGGTIAPLT